MFHVAEELLMPEYLRIADFPDATFIDENGVAHKVCFRRYNCYQTGVRRDLAKAGEYIEKENVVHHTRIGNSECRLVCARDVVDISIKVLTYYPKEIWSYDN